MLTIPCRRIGNLLIMFAEKNIYSAHPWKQEAALNAVAQHEEVNEYRGHRRLNIAAIQYVHPRRWSFEIMAWAYDKYVVYRGGSHQSPPGPRADLRPHVTVRLMEYPELYEALTTGVLDKELSKPGPTIHVPFHK